MLVLQTLYMLLECCGDRWWPCLTEILSVVINQLFSMLHEKCQTVTKHNEDAKQYIPVVTAIEGCDRLFFLFITQISKISKQKWQLQKKRYNNMKISKTIKQNTSINADCRLSSTMRAYCTYVHRIQISIYLFSFTIILPQLQQNFGTVQNQTKK